MPNISARIRRGEDGTYPSIRTAQAAWAVRHRRQAASAAHLFAKDVMPAFKQA